MENMTTLTVVATRAPAAAKATKACFAARVAERAIPGSAPWTPPTC